MSRVIPKEHQAGFQRWQANTFGAETRPTAAKVAVPSQSNPPAEGDAGQLVELAPGLPTAEQIEQTYEQARQDGFQQGYEEGRKAAEAEFSEARRQGMAQLGDLLENFRRALANLDETVGEQTLDLALEVASRVIGSTVKVRTELMVPLIREALQALPIHHGSLGIHVNPDEIEGLRADIGELASQSSFQLVPDSAVSLGGFLIKAGNSEIDAQIETRWRRVLEAIGVDPEKWLIP